MFNILTRKWIHQNTLNTFAPPCWESELWLGLAEPEQQGPVLVVEHDHVNILVGRKLIFSFNFKFCSFILGVTAVISGSSGFFGFSPGLILSL